MGVHVFLFVCRFVLLPSTFFELKRMNLKWRSQPWVDFFLELSAIQGFEGAFFEISSGSNSFIKTNCQDRIAFHLSKAVVGKIKTNCQDRMAFHLSKAVVVGKKNEESPGEDWLYSSFFAKTKRPIQPRLDQSLKGSSPRNQKTNTKINNHLGLSILDIYAKKMRLKTNNDLGCSAFTFSMQLNLEFAFNFWVLRFSDSCLQKEGKRLSIPEPIHYYDFFLPQTYLQENAIQPRVNQSLGPSHANPFPEN